MAGEPERFDFSALVASIHQVHKQMLVQAGRAVNISLTLRNWVIGYYIYEFEQNGADRAQYGQDLLTRLSRRLREDGSVVYHPRELRRCREFYTAYSWIWGVLSPKLDHLLPGMIWRSLPPGLTEKISPRIRGTAPPKLRVPAERLITSLSFSHFVELIPIDDPHKRVFYEVECLRGNWSVRELKRQIGSLYYERSALSYDKDKLAAIVKAAAEQAEPGLAIRDPYVFEFLGIKPRDVMSESDLEDKLLDKLQEFLLELGHGFCFEARQKRLLIGDTHGFIDLVFYHRILKCHVLVELKVEPFSYEHLGQLNTYVSWYRKNVMVEGDNYPVGILLCTQKDRTLVEYALAGMDNHLFVSKYLLELPKQDEMQRFLDAKLKEVGDA